MAYGPIFPHSCFPASPPHTYSGWQSKGNSVEECLFVAPGSNFAADVTWRLRWALPPVLPSGTCKLRLRALSNVSSGAAQVNPKWASVAVGEDPSSATLNAEGTSTLTWAGGDDGVYKELKATLDADTPVAGEEIVMDLVFEDSGFTLALASGWIPALIWE